VVAGSCDQKCRIAGSRLGCTVIQCRTVRGCAMKQAEAGGATPTCSKTRSPPPATATPPLPPHCQPRCLCLHSAGPCQPAMEAQQVEGAALPWASSHEQQGPAQQQQQQGQEEVLHPDLPASSGLPLGARVEVKWEVTNEETQEATTKVSSGRMVARAGASGFAGNQLPSGCAVCWAACLRHDTCALPAAVAAPACCSLPSCGT